MQRQGIKRRFCGTYTEKPHSEIAMRKKPINKLLKIITKNSREAVFETWVQRYHAALYKHALWMSGSRELAQEATQEAFFQAWLSMDKLKDSDKALAWLLTILRRSVYREQRDVYRHQETQQYLAQLDTSTYVSDQYSLLDVYKCLAGLSAKLRDTFLLHYLHGFSYEEISTQLEIPIGTVMSRISRAREELQNQQSSERKNSSDRKNVIDLELIKRGVRHDG